ncbi:MAG: gamma-glutamylcyclotransferase [Alphaproteobacteria bacterium]|nr:gamma-glutamylcyclotransferase [Alphaproteobacteria bacterium]
MINIYSEAVFFYGTLADHDLLSLVLNRPVTVGALRPALLPGYKTVAAADEFFPVCLPDPDHRTEGVAMVGPTATDLERIQFYEGVDYRLAEVTVLVEERPLRAAMCELTDRLDVTPTPWRFDDWLARDKIRSLLEAEEMMRYFNVLDFEAVEAKWLEIKGDAERRFRDGERAVIPR